MDSDGAHQAPLVMMEEDEEEYSRTIADLPDELLLAILSCDAVSVSDLGRVARTCSRLRVISETQNLWRLKLRKHWPKIWDYLPSNNEIMNWRDEVKQVICFQREVKKLVSGLSHRLYQNSHLTTPVYNEVDSLVLSTLYAPLYVKNALKTIIEDGPEHPRKPVELYASDQQWEPPGAQPRPNWQRVLPRSTGSSTACQRYEHLTEKYYALKVMSHVHQGICRREWQEFLSQPTEQQSLEVGTMLMARWFQPHTDINVKQMMAEINVMAEECRKKLRTSYPDHPALFVPLVPASDILQESKWTQERSDQLLKSINQVLFNQLKFAGNSEDYYSLKNSLINEVLSSRKGIPITLSIVYMAVCHRLGILLEPVNFPSHFLMKWKKPGTNQYEYIDAFDKGRRFTNNEVLAEVPLPLSEDDMLLSSCGALQVFQRMIRNIMNVAQMQSNISDHMELYCPATELMSLLTPTDHSVQELLLRIYYTLEIHYDRIVAGCQYLLEQSPSTILEEMLIDCQQILKSESDTPRPITPNGRNREIAYATGLVMQHKRYHYACVIFGWDKECKMPADWVRRMGVHTLRYKTKQPFYNVLVHDGSHRYAAQENLEVAEQPVPVSHSDIGKYFQKFTGTHYVPNAELQQQYPEDTAVRNSLLSVRGLL